MSKISYWQAYKVDRKAKNPHSLTPLEMFDVSIPEDKVLEYVSLWYDLPVQSQGMKDKYAVTVKKVELSLVEEEKIDEVIGKLSLLRAKEKEVEKLKKELGI